MTTQMQATVAGGGAPHSVHRMIEHLIRVAEDRTALRDGGLDALMDRFAVPAHFRSVLRDGERDELSALGIHPNYVIKWLIWSGRPTMPFFRIGHYFDRR